MGRRLAALARISLGTTLVLLVVDSVGSRVAPPSRLFRLRSSPGAPIVVEWDRARVREAARGARRLEVLRFPLGSELSVDLEIEPFEVAGPRTRFVLGRKGAQDEPIAFDPAAVTLFRGTVQGLPGSHVFLSVSDRGPVGHVDFGAGGRRYGIAPLSADRAQVFEMTGAASRQPGVPLCGVESPGVRSEGQVSLRDLTLRPDPAGAVGPTRGLKQLQLAVETDHEYYSLFGDTNAALTYLIQLYARVSDIYIRDVGTRVELVYARLWDTPDDLFNVVEPSPLAAFRDTWNATMSSVTRDAAQLISGRRDYPFGGEAYLTALCSSSAYSVAGYILGFFPDPSRPSVYAYDVGVAAHELGHNSGTRHTHDQFIDTCQNPTSQPQRGTIMSYCSQTWSGMNANEDEYFHAVSQQAMEGHLGNSACVANDCNVNGTPDAIDISAHTSADENRNAIPDECEDCNANGVLDSIELLLGSPDVNGNAVPDECEPDCNGNDVPDDADILGASTDLHGNDIPDECEEDCNANGTSDYSEIMASMPLDVNRDAILDSCQDCDLDGIPDLVELDFAHVAWVASGRTTSELRAFHPDTGVLMRVSAASAGALADRAQDLIVAPGDRVLVSSADDDRVMEFNRGGTYVGDLVPPGAGGLLSPTGITVTPDGTTLLVASGSGGTSSVLAYDLASGTPLGPFVPGFSGGLLWPFGLAFGPNDNLYVTSGTNEVLEYDGASGSFVRAFVRAADNGGLSQPRGLTFKRDGNLLVASYGTNEVLEYDGRTGAALGRWARSGTASVLEQVSPWGIRIGPNGNVFVSRTGTAFGSGGNAEHDDDHGRDHDDDIVNGGRGHRNRGELHLTNAQLYEFDARTGNFLRTYIGGNDHGLLFPTGFDFLSSGADCNFNLRQDDCDIGSGASADLDASDVPDECEVDCDGNGTVDRLDLVPHGAALDCNANGSPDACDIGAGLSADCTGNGIPDECEPDCDGNLVADSCDIAAGSGIDCNGNGVLDGCDVMDDLESSSGWVVGAQGDTANSGVWTLVDPIGTSAQPADDRTPGSGRKCFVTGQGIVGGAAGASDVDGGVTSLSTPVLNLGGYGETEIGYWRWFSNSTGGNPQSDTLTVRISNNGGVSWTTVEVVGPSGPGVSGGWIRHTFRVADFVVPTSNVVLRFVASDTGGDTVVEAAIDDLIVVRKSSAVPGEVGGLALSPASGATQLAWTAHGPGTVYDVVSGELSQLAAEQGTSGAACLVNAWSLSAWDDPRPAPLAGQGYYYLVRAETSCLAGTYGFASSGAERLPALDCP